MILDSVRLQYLIPAGVWQAAELAPGGAWSLYGVTMSPGFVPACFEGAAASTLLETHPARAADIERLAIPPGESLTMPQGSQSESRRAP